jgi:hypothetical protein
MLLAAARWQREAVSTDGLSCPVCAAAALRDADLNDDGTVSFEEFASLLRTSKADKLELFASRRSVGLWD